MVGVVLAAYALQVNQATGGESSGDESWTLLVAILAALAAIVSAIIAAIAASRSHRHSQSSLAHSEKSLEHSEKAQAAFMEFERQELDGQKGWRLKERAEAKRGRFEVNLENFLECMAKHDGKGTVGASIDCGLVTLFESDEEIRRVDEAYRKSHPKSPSVFGKLAREFDDRDAKKILEAWLAMSPKEKLAVGGLTVWIKTFPKKSY